LFGEQRSRYISVTGQLAVSDAAKRTKTKHAKSTVAFASCPVSELTSPRDVQSVSRPVRELAIRELAYPRVVQ